mmetsp:Transcript_22903/g.71127  ORF Transcript_22903/g.71127 Transcript_22903/m.71127 type:complete len:210 (-) Transcript_22903:864-1493(-)
MFGPRMPGYTCVCPPGALGVGLSRTIPSVLTEADADSPCKGVPTDGTYFLAKVNGADVKSVHHHEVVTMLQEAGGEERTLVFEMLNGMPVEDSPEEPATAEAVAEAEAEGAAAEAALEAESKEEDAPPAYEEEAPKEESGGMFGGFMKKATAATNAAIAKAQEVDEQYKISEKANKLIDDGQKKLDELDQKYKVGDPNPNPKHRSNAVC